MYNNIESDEILIKKVRAGDCDAFNPLVEKYKLPLYKVMYRMVYNRDDAEDLVEEAFIKVYRSLAKFEIGRPFYAWICRIAVNNAINYIKKEKKNKMQPIDDVIYNLAAQTGNPVAMTREKILKERIADAMARLAEPDRVILCLRVEQELSYEQIGDVLRVPRGTVMSRLARARRKLKEIFTQMGVM